MIFDKRGTQYLGSSFDALFGFLVELLLQLALTSSEFYEVKCARCVFFIISLKAWVMTDEKGTLVVCRSLIIPYSLWVYMKLYHGLNILVSCWSLLRWPV